VCVKRVFGVCLSVCFVCGLDNTLLCALLFISCYVCLTACTFFYVLLFSRGVYLICIVLYVVFLLWLWMI